MQQASMTIVHVAAASGAAVLMPHPPSAVAVAEHSRKNFANFCRASSSRRSSNTLLRSPCAQQHVLCVYAHAMQYFWEYYYTSSTIYFYSAKSYIKNVQHGKNSPASGRARGYIYLLHRIFSKFTPCAVHDCCSPVLLLSSPTSFLKNYFCSKCNCLFFNQQHYFRGLDMEVLNENENRFTLRVNRTSGGLTKLLIRSLLLKGLH